MPYKDKEQKKKYARRWYLEHRQERIASQKRRAVEHPLYDIWSKLKSRCLNLNHMKYPRYGGRGITICKEWLDFKIFESWALSRDWQKGLTIDRIDNDGNYEPGNCWFLPKSIHTSKSNHRCFIRKGFVCL